MDRTQRRHSLPRSVLKPVDDGDEIAIPTGRRKRVSFSRDLAKVRQFQNVQNTEDEDDWTADDKGTDFFYKPPEDEITVNFDPATQDTLLFATGLKSSSTPEQASRMTRKRSSLSKPAAAAVSGDVELMKEGQVSSRAHGERRLLQPMTFNSQAAEMEETALAGGQGHHTAMDVTMVGGRKKQTQGVTMEMTCMDISEEDSTISGPRTRSGASRQWNSSGSSGVEVSMEKSSGRGDGSRRKVGQQRSNKSDMSMTGVSGRSRRNRGDDSVHMELTHSDDRGRRTQLQQASDSEEDMNTGKGDGSRRKVGQQRSNKSDMSMTGVSGRGRRNRGDDSVHMELTHSDGRGRRTQLQQASDSEEDMKTGKGDGSRRKVGQQRSNKSDMSMTGVSGRSRRNRGGDSVHMELTHSDDRGRRTQLQQASDSEEDMNTGKGDGSRRRVSRPRSNRSDMSMTSVSGRSRRNRGGDSVHMELTQSDDRGRRTQLQQASDSEEDMKTAEITTEAYRKMAPEISMLPLASDDLSMVRPKASAVMGAKTSTSCVKVELKNGEVSVDEPVELMDATAEDCAPLTQVMTAKSTAAALSEDSSTSPFQEKASGVFEMELPTIDLLDESSSGADPSHRRSVKSASSRPSSSRSALSHRSSSNSASNRNVSVRMSDRQRASSFSADSSHQDVHRRRSKSLSPRKTRMSSRQVFVEAGHAPDISRLEEERVATLRQELAEAKALLAEYEAVVKLEEEVAVAHKRSNDLMMQVEERDALIQQAEKEADKACEEDKELRKLLSKLKQHEKLRLWSYESVELTKMTFKFPLGVEFDVAKLSLSVKVDSLSTANIQQADAVLTDMLTGDSMPSYRLQPCSDLLRLSEDKCRQYIRTDKLPVMLFELSALVLKLNAFLKEIERSFIRHGWFTFDTPDVLTYRVSQRSDWACYYHMKGFNLNTYPDCKLSFTYEPHVGKVPDRMSELLPALDKIPTGRIYLCRIAKVIRTAVAE